MSGAEPLRFWKMDGAGNDFVVLDGRRPVPGDLPALARRVCARRGGIGADGLLVVTPESGGGLRVAYCNADGSPACFCGNGARCAALFGRTVLGIDALVFPVRFSAGIFEADCSGPLIAITIEPPVVRDEPLDLEVEGRRVPVRVVEAGVLHVTGAESRERSLPLDRWAEALAAVRPDLAREANITLAAQEGPQTLRVRTLERGAGETAACGSGAVAAAAWARSSRVTGDGPVTILPPSGERLLVELTDDGARLLGPARFVFRGEIDLPAT